MPGSRQADAYDHAVGARARSLRVARGMSQTELGRLLGISFQQVQKYEHGSNRISAGRLRRIAEIFDVPLAALFGTPQLHPECVADPLEALRTIGAARLLQAYGRIGNAQVRRAFVRLAEQMAMRNANGGPQRPRKLTTSAPEADHKSNPSQPSPSPEQP